MRSAWCGFVVILRSPVGDASKTLSAARRWGGRPGDHVEPRVRHSKGAMASAGGNRREVRDHDEPQPFATCSTSIASNGAYKRPEPLDPRQRPGRAIRELVRPTGGQLARHFRRQGARGPRLRRRLAPSPHRRRRRGHRRLPGRPPGDISRRVRPAPALPPRRVELGRSNLPDPGESPSGELVSKLVLIAPSGLLRRREPAGDGRGPAERLRLARQIGLSPPVTLRSTDSLVGAIERKFQSRKWKKGILRTLRGTVGHSVSDLLDRVPHPTLLIWGSDDRVISDVAGSIRAADPDAPKARQLVIPKCGHAPQIEKARGSSIRSSPASSEDRLKGIPPTSSTRPGSSPKNPEPEAWKVASTGSSTVTIARADPDETPCPSGDDERPLAVLRQIPQARHQNRQPGAQLPLAGAGPPSGTSTGPTPSVIVELGAGTGPITKRHRRAGRAKDQGGCPRARSRLRQAILRERLRAGLAPLRCGRRRRPRPLRPPRPTGGSTGSTTSSPAFPCPRSRRTSATRSFPEPSAGCSRPSGGYQPDHRAGPGLHGASTAVTSTRSGSSSSPATSRRPALTTAEGSRTRTELMDRSHHEPSIARLALGPLCRRSARP